MACGLPPVVADLPQYAAYIRNDETGLVFQRGEGEIDRLTTCLERLAGDSSLRDRLSESAIEAASRYGLNPIADAYLDEFTTSMEAARSRTP
jgi:glycosyltransferase involved in cell wall biosynthesis